MKRFLILGNMNAVTYKDIFPLFKEKKMWYGVTIHSGSVIFSIPNRYNLRSAICGFDKDGKRLIGVRWFTNIPHNKLRALELTQTYSPDKYLKYDNSDAIEVNKIKNIPKDYKGIMGVPITIFDYNTDDIEIICLNNKTNSSKHLYLNGKEIYARIIIRFKK